eukprot:TRINITY_DN110800_c0_g1_i1.p1 TRINITY_DN110800_c0_g1~~TRINITY_DN110800_c0_g1_i1.p1  ORF type:complete len:527 (-),score=55.72 TRINITY_DN110800_c0_g1_i1:477-2057(-)
MLGGQSAGSICEDVALANSLLLHIPASSLHRACHKAKEQSRGTTNGALSTKQILQGLAEQKRQDVASGLHSWLAKSCGDHEGRILVNYNVVLSALSKCGLWQLAINCLGLIRTRQVSPSTVTYNTAMSACSRASAWQWASALFEQVGSCSLRVDAVTCSALCGAYGSSNAWASATDVLEMMMTAAIRTDAVVCNAVVAACAKASQLERALEVMDYMDEHYVRKDAFTYSGAASACIGTGDWRRAFTLLAELKALRINTNTAVYNTIISSCEAQGHWQGALALLEEMRAIRLHADPITYGAALSVCEKGWAWQRAVELFSDMRARSVPGNVITLNAVISACEKGYQWKMALAALASGSGLSTTPDTISYSAAVSACAACRERDKASELFQQMQLDKIEANIVTFGALAHALEDSGHWRQAAQILVDLRCTQIRRNYIVVSAVLGVLTSRTGVTVGTGWALALNVLSGVMEPGLLASCSEEHTVAAQDCRTIVSRAAVSAWEARSEWARTLGGLRSLLVRPADHEAPI